MNWNQLLSRKRLGVKENENYEIRRTDFQRDFDRIIFSSALRRMQDKTQVFPLSKIDYVRTRLTHSLETSSVGRSLGTLVGEQIIQRYQLKDYQASDIGDICAAACLAHDIGNPPFGHSGEDAIRHWATNTPLGQQRLQLLTPQEQADFLQFEGNAQGFRVLARLQNVDNVGGLQLTCATFAAFTKYPREADLNGQVYSGASAKKQGFTLNDKSLFKEVAKEVGLISRSDQQAIWFRHPLAFIIEAADDICYRVIDIEDGYRLGHISYVEAESHFLANIKDKNKYFRRLSAIKGDQQKIEFLRSKVINEAIGQVKSCFLDNEKKILIGQFDRPLIKEIPNYQALSRLREFARQKIYVAPEVLEIDVVGFRIIRELLDQFIPALDDVVARNTDAQALHKILCKMLPQQFVGDKILTPEKNHYLRLLKLTDFIAGMTDSYALTLYQKLTGIFL